MITESRAISQRCLYCGKTYPLFPPVFGGCPVCATADFKAPLEVDYDYPDSIDWLAEAPLPDITRYAPLLPPLVKTLSLGEGGTPLIKLAWRGSEIYLKDESRNPTWSHKDRLNLITISAAKIANAVGIVVPSSGNHGASAAAYAAFGGLPAVILCTPRPAAVASFLQAYGQLVLAVPDSITRIHLTQRLVNELGFHPVGNHTVPPTNHPFGSEGYKTIAYELYRQLEHYAPEAIFVPVGFSELIFGIYKGFKELKRYGLIKEIPRMVACEPGAGAPLKHALESNLLIAHVTVQDSQAYAIAVPVNSYRGIIAIRESQGIALALSEQEMQAAQAKLASQGLWAEISSSISFAGLLKAQELGLGNKGPLVCINTSSGFKDSRVGLNPVTVIDGSWDSLVIHLVERKMISTQ